MQRPAVVHRSFRVSRQDLSLADTSTYPHLQNDKMGPFHAYRVIALTMASLQVFQYHGRLPCHLGISLLRLPALFMITSGTPILRISAATRSTSDGTAQSHLNANAHPGRFAWKCCKICQQSDQ